MHAFRVGKVFGIELRVDWSWVFIFVLMTWNLVAVFSNWHPDWSPLGRLATAAAASVVFFSCIVLHELAHSLVATAYGVRVRSITLFLFGGVSNIEHEPPSAGAEFLTAIVGPLTSIALGVAFFLLTDVVTPISAQPADNAWSALAQLGPLATLLAWLGPINVAIGLFNLIPGFPLDGGRIFRAALWKITGDLRRATAGASMVGQCVGWLFIAGGIAMSFGARLPFFGTGLASGLWIAFIGWFLHAAAAQARTRVALDDALSGMTVGELMRRRTEVVAPDLSVTALVHDHIVPGDDRALPVVRNGALVGLVSISDVRKLAPNEWSRTSVGDIMRNADSLSVTTPTESLATAFAELARRDVDQLPVVSDGALVGMLRRKDVARWLELAWHPGDTAPHHHPA